MTENKTVNQDGKLVRIHGQAIENLEAIVKLRKSKREPVRNQVDVLSELINKQFAKECK